MTGHVATCLDVVQMAEKPKEGLEELQRMLRSVSTMYRQLARAATVTKVPIPPEAQLIPSPAAAAAAAANGDAAQRPAGPGPLFWDEYAAANAADWDDFNDEGACRGFFDHARNQLQVKNACLVGAGDDSII